MEKLYQAVAISNTWNYQALITLVYFMLENIQPHSCLLNRQLAWDLGFMFLKSVNKKKHTYMYFRIYKMLST